jgi:hypothetical protein
VFDTTTVALPEIVYCLALLKESVNLNDTDEIYHPEAKWVSRIIQKLLLPLWTSLHALLDLLLIRHNSMYNDYWPISAQDTR